MDVDDDRLHGAAQRVLGELGVERPERVVGQRHEQAAQHLQDEHALAARGADLGDAAPGRARREVERADDPRLAVDVADQLALVPDMVAHGQDVGTGGQELVGDGGGEAVAAGGVLAR